MKRLISAHKAVHTTHIKTVVFAEADHIFAKVGYFDVVQAKPRSVCKGFKLMILCWG